ncbi:hypothetical protein HHI36_017632 [Cryptolaemus montrouzieri]|uniref:Uncharacterized protein n=1 Tax=Cryptolaemus montrouzieri TaxID=559131 RepID=A0ABD2NNT3_9CUCU
MSSVLKPSLTASVPQNSQIPSQLNKPMHPQQGPPQSYGQPSNHHPMMPHGNPTAAHNHPTTHQPNHYSLNVPNASGHYLGNNQPIPASNHPVASNPSQSSGQQLYGGVKNMVYQGGYQPNLGHPPNQPVNQLPPVSQTLPATNSQLSQHTAEDHSDRSQSNGTSEEKSNYTQENHVTTPKETSNTPALPTQPPPSEKLNSSPDKPVEAQKTAEQEKPVALDTASNASSSSGALPVPESTVQKSPQTAESVTQSVSKVSESVDNASGSPTKEVTQTESSGSAHSEKKTEEIKSNEAKDEVSAEEPIDEGKKAARVVETESANTPTESEKAACEVKETEVKEKVATTPKSRAIPRKPTKPAKNEEESPKTPKSESKPSPPQKSPSTSKSKRARIRTQPYQSPLPELEIISKISASSSQRNKTNDDKLTVFFKNEFLAVRNSEGTFYVCQAVQNIYKSSAKIRIRWLSQDKNDKTNQIYTPDFYDNTDFDCILTNLNLERVEKGKFRLPPAEKERTDSILKRSLAAEMGEEIPSPTVNEEHPDGLDLSLYKDENQLNKRKAKKRPATSPLKSPRSSSRTPSRKSPEKAKVAKATPKSSRKPVAQKETPVSTKKATVSTPAPKKTSGSRTERAKRRSDNASSTKVSPVSPKVDQKKAKALAKVARKSVVTTPKAQTPAKKRDKTCKIACPTSEGKIKC